MGQRRISCFVSEVGVSKMNSPGKSLNLSQITILSSIGLKFKDLKVVSILYSLSFMRVKDHRMNPKKQFLDRNKPTPFKQGDYQLKSFSVISIN